MTALNRRSQEKGIVENLIRSVKHADQDTACVKIPRSLDGRMQGWAAESKIILCKPTLSDAEKNYSARNLLPDLAG